MQKGWSVQKTTLSFSLWPVSAQNLQQKDGYLSQNDFGSRFSAIACRFFLVPMAHFGIESIAKKDGYPSQNDFALFALWLVFGIEGLMQKGWSVQKMTLSFSQWPVSAQNLQRKGRIPFSKRLRVPLQRDSVSVFSRPNGSFRHRIYSEKGRVPFSKRLCPVPEGDRLRRWRL